MQSHTPARARAHTSAHTSARAHKCAQAHARTGTHRHAQAHTRTDTLTIILLSPITMYATKHCYITYIHTPTDTSMPAHNHKHTDVYYWHSSCTPINTLVHRVYTHQHTRTRSQTRQITHAHQTDTQSFTKKD